MAATKTPAAAAAPAAAADGAGTLTGPYDMLTLEPGLIDQPGSQTVKRLHVHYDAQHGVVR